MKNPRAISGAVRPKVLEKTRPPLLALAGGSGGDRRPPGGGDDGSVILTPKDETVLEYRGRRYFIIDVDNASEVRRTPTLERYIRIINPAFSRATGLRLKADRFLAIYYGREYITPSEARAFAIFYKQDPGRYLQGIPPSSNRPNPESEIGAKLVARIRPRRRSGPPGTDGPS